MNYYDEEGFSLLEVSLAVGIMAILTALAIPTFSGMIPAVQAKASEQENRNCLIENQLDKLTSQANGVTPATPQECTTTAP